MRLAIGIIAFPKEGEEERAKSFAVHLYYVTSLASQLLQDYGPRDILLRNLVRTQRSLAGFNRIPARPRPHHDYISRFLRISWASELQLRLGEIGDSAVLRYSNVWAPVHAYYAIYMSMQAWFAANAMAQLIDDHTSSLRTISNHVTQRCLFPLPWAATGYGCPQLNQMNYRGLPPSVDPNVRIEVLSRPSPDTFWLRYCKLLKTTRERRLDRNFRIWKQKNHRKAMKEAEKLEVSRKLVDTTLFDFFWRLRIRSQYQDVGSFLTWNVSQQDHIEFRTALITIVDATCTLFESLITKAGAGTVRDNVAGEFLSSFDDALSDLPSFVTIRQHVLSSTA